MKNKALHWFFSAFILLCIVSPSPASKVLLKIEATNPAARLQKIDIRAYLPPDVRKTDIADLAGLDLDYDVKRASYYVFTTKKMAPKEMLSFEVQLNDIWTIPEEELAALNTHLDHVAGLLRSPDRQAAGESLVAQAKKTLSHIRTSQLATEIPKVQIDRHISAYAENILLMKAVRQSVGTLELMALSDKRDPGRLLGAPDLVKNTSEKEAASGNRKAVLKITIQNTSESEPRNMPIKYFLPREITADDVIDAGILEVRTDLYDGFCYLYKENMYIPPGEKASLDVLLRDKWMVDPSRIADLKTEAARQIKQVKKWRSYESVEKRLQAGIAELNIITSKNGPETVSPEYVAYYRDQKKQVDRIEMDINWVKTMVTSGALGPALPPPSTHSTWLIIYIILGFLAFVTLIVVFYSVRKTA